MRTPNFSFEYFLKGFGLVSLFYFVLPFLFWLIYIEWCIMRHSSFKKKNDNNVFKVMKDSYIYSEDGGFLIDAW